MTEQKRQQKPVEKIEENTVAYISLHQTENKNVTRVFTSQEEAEAYAIERSSVLQRPVHIFRSYTTAKPAATLHQIGE